METVHLNASTDKSGACWDEGETSTIDGETVARLFGSAADPVECGGICHARWAALVRPAALRHGIGVGQFARRGSTVMNMPLGTWTANATWPPATSVRSTNAPSQPFMQL